MTETKLGGGRTTGAVRIGETVRRSTGPWTDTVHAFLRHLRARGFDGCPDVLGIDDQGREILSFIPGSTIGDDMDPDAPVPETVKLHRWPAWYHSDGALVSVGALLRKAHEASRGFAPARPTWRYVDRPMHKDEIVCHGDLGPWNTVYREGKAVAFIDWDCARPDTPLRDLAGAAWNYVPLRNDEYCVAIGFGSPPDRASRLRLFCDAYGLDERSDLFEALVDVKIQSMDLVRQWKLRPELAAEFLEGAGASLRWLGAMRRELERAL